METTKISSKKMFVVWFLMLLALASGSVGWTFSGDIMSYLKSRSTNETFFIKTAWAEVSPDGQTNATIVVQKVVGGKLNPKQMLDVALGGDLPKPGQLVMFGIDQKLVVVGAVAESVTQLTVPVETTATPTSDSVVDPISPPAVKQQEKFAPVIPSRKTTVKK